MLSLQNNKNHNDFHSKFKKFKNKIYLKIYIAILAGTKAVNKISVLHKKLTFYAVFKK